MVGIRSSDHNNYLILLGRKILLNLAVVDEICSHHAVEDVGVGGVHGVVVIKEGAWRLKVIVSIDLSIQAHIGIKCENGGGVVVEKLKITIIEQRLEA